MKFNQQFFEAAYGAVQSGIPFLAGMPLISSLMDFGLHTNYAWFLISSIAIPQEDLVWKLDLDGNVVDRNFNSNAIEGPLENHQILNIVHTKAMPLFWEEAIEKIKMVRSEYRGETSFSSFFGIGYKPTYFVILET